MALRESGEDYLESIYVLSERQGTVRSIDVARQMWERHCFFVGLLEDAGVSAEVASQEGCHMEHCLSEESFEKLRAMLGRDSDRDQ